MPKGSVLNSALEDLFLKVVSYHLGECQKKGLTLPGVQPGGEGGVYVGQGLVLKLSIRPRAMLEFGMGRGGRASWNTGKRDT